MTATAGSMAGKGDSDGDGDQRAGPSEGNDRLSLRATATATTTMGEPARSGQRHERWAENGGGHFFIGRTGRRCETIRLADDDDADSQYGPSYIE